MVNSLNEIIISCRLTTLQRHRRVHTHYSCICPFIKLYILPNRQAEVCPKVNWFLTYASIRNHMLSLKSLSAPLAISLLVWEGDEKSLAKLMNSEETGWLHWDADLKEWEVNLWSKIFTWSSSCPAQLVSILLITTSKHWGGQTNTRQMVREKQLPESREAAGFLSVIDYCKRLVFDSPICHH